MKMKKVVAGALAVAMTAAVSIGATLAYLTDTDEDVNVMTLGNVKIDQLEYERVDDETFGEDAEVQEFHDNKPLYPAVTDKDFDYTPGDTDVDWTQIGKNGYSSDIWNPDSINNELDKMVFVKNKGKSDAYVRTIFAFEAGKYTTLDEFKAMMHLNLNETDFTWDWIATPVTIGESTYFVATATYNKVLAPGALTEISLSQIALDKTATNADVEAFGETYQILVKTQAIQTAGFDNAAMALDEGFGVVTETNIPWENDNPTVGAGMKNALHYLEADPTGTQITTKVSNVTFGLKKNHADIVANDDYASVVADVEQDVPATVYYVPNGSNYDLYFLAEDVIYAPADSASLFDGMTALQSVNTADLDVSRAQTMLAMFRGCSALTSVDLTGWDTSKVTNMKTMFYNCSALTELIGLGQLDTSSVTDMYGMFSGCKKLVSLDCSGWDTSKVTTMMGMFNACSVLETVELADWDTGNVTSFSAMFQNAKKIKNIDMSKWDTANVTDMSGMFKNCIAMEDLDVSGWKVDKVTRFNSMFSSGSNNAGNMKFKKLDVENWNPISAVYMNHMFYGCGALTELDLSKWNTPDLYTTSHMFADCYNLKVLDTSGWTTSASLYSLDAMFNDCHSVKLLDMSNFDTSGVREFGQIFESCYSLKQIKGLENWNTSNGRVFDEIFWKCNSLQEVNLSSFDTSNVCKGFKSIVGDSSKGFSSSFVGVDSLQKLVLGENFDFDGDGTVSAKATLPNPAPIDGVATKWYNAENDTYYEASEIPDHTAATYVAAVPPANP